LSEGSRELKFQELGSLKTDDEAWVEAPVEWRAPFLPAGAAVWVSYPALEDLFKYNGSGVMAGRTWVIAPDADSLRRRWNRLRDEQDPEIKATLFHPHLRDGKPGDKHVAKAIKERLTGSPNRTYSVANDEGEVIEPIQFAFRSFDRQWIIPDARLINQPNPKLWKAASGRQVYLTALMAHSPSC
jgi:hypothetical protein